MVVITVIATIVFGTMLWSQPTIGEIFSLNEDDGIKKAVIIDQLHDYIPNQSFQEKATKYLGNAGYAVDVFKSEDITVDFYKKLPSMGYDFIVIRSHALIGRAAEDPVILLTNEKYTTDKYIYEQLFGIIDIPLLNVRDTIHYSIEDLQETNKFVYTRHISSQGLDWKVSDDHETYFGIGPKAVEEMMVGQFPGSTIILGGCNTLSNTLMAEAFLKKGASEIIGWDGSVYSSDNDRVMLAVLVETLKNNMYLDEAVDVVMENFTPVPGFPANLQYYSQKTNIEI